MTCGSPVNPRSKFCTEECWITGREEYCPLPSDRNRWGLIRAFRMVSKLWDWRNKRMWTMAGLQPTCVTCGLPVPISELQAHHKTPYGMIVDAFLEEEGLTRDEVPLIRVISGRRALRFGSYRIDDQDLRIRWGNHYRLHVILEPVHRGECHQMADRLARERVTQARG